MPLKKRSKETESANTSWTNEGEAQCGIFVPLMGKEAIEAWEKDKMIAPAEGLDDIFNKKSPVVEVSSGVLSVGGAMATVQEVADLFEPTSDMDEQAVAIEVAIKDIKQLLIEKHRSYAGSAFKDVVLGGRLITAEEAILVRIADKIRRLTEGEEYGAEDTFQDLLGYLVLRMAAKKFKETK
jgi:hypothetical protein